MLRTLFILAIASFGAYHSLRGPFFALLFYLWIAYFRPEYWVWSSFIASLPLSLIVGVFLLINSIARSAPFRLDLRSVALFALLGHGLVSTLLSEHFAYTFAYWTDFAKACVIAYLMAILVNDVAKVRLTMLVITASLGFEVAKQGWAELLRNPGAKNANYHPFLGDENGVALGVLMLVPLIMALGETATSKWERRGFTFLTIGAVYRAISTYSRGAFLSSGVLAVTTFMRSERKLPTLAAFVLIAGIVFPVLPDEFWDRMNTIAFSEEELNEDDVSSRGRLHFWRVAVEMANDRPFVGVGLNGFNPSYNKYDFLHGAYGVSRAVHSTWFGVLAELGYPGMALFLLNIGLALWACHRVQSAAAAGEVAKELGVYARAIQTSIIVFMAGGSFLTAQYLEMLWHFIGLSAAIFFVAQHPVEAVAPVQVSGSTAQMPDTRLPVAGPPLWPKMPPAPARPPSPAFVPGLLNVNRRE